MRKTLAVNLLCNSLALLCAPAFAQKPVAKVTCVMANHSYVVSHFNQKELKPDEIDDFWIGGYNADDKGGCTITVGDKVLYKAPLVTAHPTSSHDAIVAIDEFRKQRAPQILKEKERK